MFRVKELLAGWLWGLTTPFMPQCGVNLVEHRRCTCGKGAHHMAHTATLGPGYRVILVLVSELILIAGALGYLGSTHCTHGPPFCSPQPLRIQAFSVLLRPLACVLEATVETPTLEGMWPRWGGVFRPSEGVSQEASVNPPRTQDWKPCAIQGSMGQPEGGPVHCRPH